MGEVSQQPTCPHWAQRRRCTHHPPDASHSTQPGPLGATVGSMPVVMSATYDDRPTRQEGDDTPRDDPFGLLHRACGPRLRLPPVRPPVATDSVEPLGVAAHGQAIVRRSELRRRVQPAQPAKALAPVAAAGGPGEPHRAAGRAAPAQPDRHPHARPDTRREAVTLDQCPHLAGRYRTADGSYNALDDPDMGMAGSRFGRNVALDKAVPGADARADGAQPAHDQPHADAARRPSRRPRR